MRITIIPIDGAVYLDGQAFIRLDLSFVPADVHALQFNTATNAGWIEFKQDDFGDKPNNEKITQLPDWADVCLVKWNEAKEKDDNLLLSIQNSVASANLANTN
jgi:hypothetical protein